MSAGSSRSERRRDRETWPVRIVRQDAVDGDDLSSTTTTSERLAMVDQLTRDAWKLGERPSPEYERCDMPIRVLSNADAATNGS